tara:strand:+ start:861 stop:1352 length:492 start_codon:yes stop_codon:yes gene_type:complete
MLTLNQLLKLEEKTVDGNITRLTIEKSEHAKYGKNCDYKISGIMPVKINIKDRLTNIGIQFDLHSLLHKYAEEKHESRYIYGQGCGIVKDSNEREFKIELPSGLNWDNDPDFVEIAGYYMYFNTFYYYHRRTQKAIDRLDKIYAEEKAEEIKRNKENKNKKEK